MKKFHRAVSLTLLALASLILSVELFRASSGYPRIVLPTTLALFAFMVKRASAKLGQPLQSTRSADGTIARG